MRVVVVGAGIVGAAIWLVAIFLPGVLLVTGALPFWSAFRSLPRAQAAMRGTNAAVVGILAAALYSPVWTSAILGPRDFAAALGGFVLLTAFRAPPVVVVVLHALFAPLPTAGRVRSRVAMVAAPLAASGTVAYGLGRVLLG